MTKEQLTKARSYAIDKMRYNEIHSIFNEVETTVQLVELLSGHRCSPALLF